MLGRKFRQYAGEEDAKEWNREGLLIQILEKAKAGEWKKAAGMAGSLSIQMEEHAKDEWCYLYYGVTGENRLVSIRSRTNI